MLKLLLIMSGVLSPVTSRRDAPGRNDSPGSADLNLEYPRDFHFAVTWVTLFAHLDPIEAKGPWRPATVQPREIPSTALALVPVVIPTPPMLLPEVMSLPQAAGDDSNAAWEMVVPKMVRMDGGNFAPAESGEPKLL
jgi:hypothetical protein